MTKHEEPIEAMLSRYRPADPPEQLRERLLLSSTPASQRPSTLACKCAWFGAAAAVAFAFLLQLDATRIEIHTQQMLAADRVPMPFGSGASVALVATPQSARSTLHHLMPSFGAKEYTP